MLERRQHSRSRAFAAGTVAWGRRGEAVDCVVRDLSEGGALLLLDEPRRAPVEMELAMRGGARPARVVWRGEAGVGVAFAATRAAATPASTLRQATVVSLDAARRARAGDAARLAERIARFVEAPRPHRPA